MTCWWRESATIALMLALTGCGGSGGSGGVNSTPAAAPAPAPTPLPTPTPTPTPAAFFETAEYRRSANVGYHGAISAYVRGASGEGVTVGVIDTGLSDPNGEFAGRISPASRGFGANDGYVDVFGHGTAVAATIAAARNNRQGMGVAWAATIMALRTDESSGCSTDGCTHPTSSIAAAIDHGWQNGARVINISLGGGAAPDHLLQAVSRATAAGTIIVIAAGNYTSGTPLVAPDELAQSIADPAYSRGLVIITPSANANDTVSSFSAGVRGFENISIAGMGNQVSTIDHLGGERPYSGTSFAAPQISGAVALLAHAFPNLTGKQIVDLLLSTARDVGAPGPDARYGRGILDIAAAFAPSGALTLAGTGVSISPDMASGLSSPMGDARPTGISAVALDGLKRAYEVDLAQRFAGRGPTRSFVSALDATQRHLNLGSPALSLALNVTPGIAAPTGFGLRTRHENQARLRSATLRAHVTRRTGVALGLNTGVMALERQLTGVGGGTFLMAEQGFEAQRADMRPASAFMLTHGLGHGVNLTGGFEAGDMTAPLRHPGRFDPVADRKAPYHAVAMALGWRGPVVLSTGLSLLREPRSALGARFSPTLGAQSAQSLFARLGLAAQPAARLTLSAHWQRGWTWASAGGALPNGGMLTSQSWSADVDRRDLIEPGDRLGLRVSQPLRIIASRFDLFLPAKWDWKNETTTNRIVPLNLVPHGRQRDYELSYGRGVGAGHLTTNLFLREQSGNIAAMPDELGVALRWSLGF